MDLVIDEHTRTTAAAAALPPTDTAPAGAAPAALPREYLSFRVGAEEYGIDILRVQEIRSHEAPTRIANAPAFIRGIINLRGVIVPIVDLRLKLGCDSAEVTASTVVIVLNVRGHVVGAVVDAVSDVLQLTPEQIKAAPEMTSSLDGDAILGIGCLPGAEAQRMLILIDIEAMMGGADLGLIGNGLH